MISYRAARALAASAALAGLSACGANGDSALRQPFQGATVRIVVGFAPGGTYDLQARLLAGHLGGHLPGHPRVVVENMPGAGGALAANYIAHAAPRDGFTIGLLVEVSAPALATGNLLNDVHILGSPAATVPVMVFSKRSGIATLDDWRRRPVPPRIASSGPRALTDVVPRVAAATLSLPATMVPGYTGTSEIRHAMENGEVDGVCLTIDSVRPLFGSPSAVNQVLQFSRSPQDNPDIPDALSLATQERARQILETGVYEMAPLVRFLAAPKGVRADLVDLLRAGLLQTWSDAAFLEAANEIGIEIAPVTANRLEQTVRHLASDKSVVAELRSILDVR